MSFTSASSKELHRQARASKSLYDAQIKEKKGSPKPYSDFLKKSSNPALELVKTFEVTFEMDITGEGYTFGINQETFTISVKESDMIDNNLIEERVKQGVSDIFRGKAKSFVYDNVQVKTNTLRGIEEVEKVNIDYDEIVKKGAFTNDLDNFEVVKTNKGSTPNKNKYSLDLWF